MAIPDLSFSIEIKDPLHGYIGLTELEESILDLRMTQRLRSIRAPAGIHQVYPGADQSLMGRLIGFLHITDTLFDSLRAEREDLLKARLVSMFLTISRGPWSNVMEEYLTVRGRNRRTRAKMAVENSPATEIIENSSFSVEEIVDVIENGISVKGIDVDLLTIPINPELVDSLERDAYFAGVEYAQLEYRRLFDATRIAKNKIAVERGSVYTLESYLSAGANMYDAVYYHKTVRAAELMLLRILDEAASMLFEFPREDPKEFLSIDDWTFHDMLMHLPEDPTEEVKLAAKVFDSFRNRYLIKLASSRAIADHAFLTKLATPDGLYDVEREIAEEADIDPKNVYVDYPNRPSVEFYPGKYSLDDVVFFERGSRGYEFWDVMDLSLIARSYKRDLRPVRVYTTRGYRSRVKKVGDRLLESVDIP